IFIDPPAPLSPFVAPIIPIQTALGDVLFYFDEWDTIGDNIAGEPPSGYASFFVHFVPDNVPNAVEALFLVDDRSVANALFWNSNQSDLVALRNRATNVKSNETPEEFAERKKAQAVLQERERELQVKSEKFCDSVFSNSEIATYFLEVGATLQNITQRFLEVLRLYYNQYLLPDRPVLNWSYGHWLLSESVVLDRNDKTSQ